MEVKITSSNFEQEVINSEIPVLIDFWATWCGPCRMIAPIVEEIAKEFAGKVKVGKVNVDEEMPLAVKYSIESIPTLILFKNGIEQKREIGFCDKEQLLKLING